MKTTVEIADPLFREAKREAERAGITLRELLEAGLRKILDERKRAEAKPFKLADGSVPGKLSPGIRDGDWRQMRAVMYGARAGYAEGTLDELDRELDQEAALELDKGRDR